MSLLETPSIVELFYFKKYPSDRLVLTQPVLNSRKLNRLDYFMITVFSTRTVFILAFAIFMVCGLRPQAAISMGILSLFSLFEFMIEICVINNVSPKIVILEDCGQ